MKKILLVAAFVSGGLSLPVPGFAQEQEKEAEATSIRVLIDGKPALIEEVDSLPAETFTQMHYLHGRDALNLMGPAGAGGVLLVKTSSKQELPEAVALKGGRRIPLDSLEGTFFNHIHVIRGQQARNLYGPGAAGGVLLIQPKKEEKTAEK